MTAQPDAPGSRTTSAVARITSAGTMPSSPPSSREAAELSASFRAPSPKRSRRQQPQPSMSTVVLRRSLRTRGLPPSDASSAVASSSPATPPSPPKPRTGPRGSPPRSPPPCTPPPPRPPLVTPPRRRWRTGSAPGGGLVLRPTDVRRVLPKRILSLRILPLADRTVVATGDMIGHIGLWDVDGAVEDEEVGDGADGVFEYSPHMGPVPAIVAHPAEPGKIYSCSYDGEIYLMDVEKETFDVVQRCDYPIISLCQAPNNVSCLYFGEGNGELKLFDERMGKVTTTWNVHYSRINSIDCHPENTNMFATS